MANDKDFTLKEGIEVGGSTKNSLGTISASNAVDLSTGNYFTHTPAGPTTYSFTNPGAVQSFQMQLTGGQEAVANSFNTTLYSGNGGTQSINTGIDLAGDGGLVWTKCRNNTHDHHLFDTERGVLKRLRTNSEATEHSEANSLTAFNSNGHTLGSEYAHNGSTQNFVSWTFKKTPKFFDVQTVTTDSSGNATVNHDLGSSPGFVIVKGLNVTDGWYCFHVDRGVNKFTNINTSDVETSFAAWTNVSSTSFGLTFGSTTYANKNMVLYLFGHDTTADSMIKCGSYAGNGTATNAINLGWTPQFVLLKEYSNSSGGGQSWHLFDSARGAGTSGNDPYLRPSSAGDEQGSNIDNIDFTSTGFTLKRSDGAVNGSGDNYIYVAIRSAAATSITYPSSVKFQGGIAPQTPANGETDLLTFSTKDGGTSYTGVHSIDNAS